MIEQFVIIEKLKEFLKGRKVLAAVFYTFNFDTKFFENYLLPVFLPQVNFSEIEIQNTILWRKYIKELPPITVNCDFHAKSNDAPTLGYTVRTIDIKTKNGSKPCFHPKNSFILMDDGSLLTISGSNNLSVGGWCTNVEGVSIFEMKNGIYLPYSLKHDIRNFVCDVIQKYDNTKEHTKAEQLIILFLNQRKYTEHVEKKFYSSISKTFFELLSELRIKNDNLPFSRIEVISPYFSSNLDFVKKTLQFSEDENIYALIPYCATNIANITKDTYDKFKKAGLIWSGFIKTNNDTVFRLTHSKIYRLKGEKEMFTIIGSVNYTEAGWMGLKLNGNIESAIIYIEPFTNWNNLLIEYNNEIVFSISNIDETNHDLRYNVPDLFFTLDWLEKKLFYDNPQKNNFRGIIMLIDKNYEISTGVNFDIKLTDNQLISLADNSIIKVHEYVTQREFYYFPVHKNIETRPYSSKLRLNDRELLELWQQVSIKEQAKNEISDLLEKFILTRLDNDGEMLEKHGLSKSTMNMMASHINALIRLQERIFTIPTKIGEYKNAKELIDYYLFTNNIDTLIGYRNLLKDMLKEESILPSIEWFLLNILIIDFYDFNKIKRVYEQLKQPQEGLKHKIDKVREGIEIEMKFLKKSIKPGEITEDLYKWIVNQIRK